MKATGDFVSLAAKLATSVQNSEHYFGCALAFVGARGVRINGNSAAVVVNTTSAIGEKCDANAVTETSHRFVDRVVDDFPNEVVKAGETSGADVHTGALANGIESFENLNVLRAVVSRRVLFRCRHCSNILTMWGCRYRERRTLMSRESTSSPTCSFNVDNNCDSRNFNCVAHAGSSTSTVSRRFSRRFGVT